MPGWLGAGALAIAILSSAFAWHGGLWATPLWVVLAIATWRRARRQARRRPASVGIVMAAAAVIVGAYGFASSGGFQPALRTDSASYVPGESVGIRLKAGIRSVGYNLCAGAVLERLGPDVWHRVDLRDEEGEARMTACTLEQRGLPPLLGVRGEVDLPHDLRPGIYRLGQRVEVGGERRWVRARPFVVGR